jgi:hypothetical protein
MAFARRSSLVKGALLLFTLACFAFACRAVINAVRDPPPVEIGPGFTPPSRNNWPGRAGDRVNEPDTNPRRPAARGADL